MIDMLNRAADILRSEGWEQEAAVVSKAADEIERLRSALRLSVQAIAAQDALKDEIERLRDALRRISHAPCGKVYCADGHEEAVLIARVALEGEKKNG